MHQPNAVERSPLGLRVVVSPSAGRVRLLPPVRFDGGREVVDAGQALAHVETRTARVVVRADVSGHVNAVLAIEGEPVSTGQPVFAIEPTGAGR